MPFANPSVPGCGQFDVFVARLDPATLSLIYWTCIQGRYQQAPITIFDLAVDHTGSAIVGGYVNNRDFPLVSALIPVYRGFPGYIKKLLPNGDIAFSTIFGGSRSEQIWSLAVDREGDIYLAGTAQSADLPVVRPVSSVTEWGHRRLSREDRRGRPHAAVFDVLRRQRHRVIWGVAVDNNGEAWVVGDTHSIVFRPPRMRCGPHRCADAIRRAPIEIRRRSRRVSTDGPAALLLAVRTRERQSHRTWGREAGGRPRRTAQ